MMTAPFSFNKKRRVITLPRSSARTLLFLISFQIQIHYSQPKEAARGNFQSNAAFGASNIP
jgi:hypothetical protein